MKSGGGRRCVFFDRDGVVNRSPGAGYVLSPEAFELNPGIAETLCWLREREIAAVVVTSQRCVGKGLLTREGLAAIHRLMAGRLKEKGASFDGIYCHLGDGGPDDFPAKPDPGMIFAAVERLDLDLRQSWIVGDADRDIIMGKRAGLAGTIRITGDHPISCTADHTLHSTAEIPKLLQEIL